MAGPVACVHCTMQCAVHARTAAHTRKHARIHLHPSPADTEACCWVHQVGCCPKRCQGLLLDGQGATHRDVAPLLFMNLTGRKHTQAGRQAHRQARSSIQLHTTSVISFSSLHACGESFPLNPAFNPSCPPLPQPPLPSPTPATSMLSQLPKSALNPTCLKSAKLIQTIHKERHPPF